MPYVRYEIEGMDLLDKIIAELKDDYSQPWNAYPCLEWTRNRDKDGYGSLYTKRKDGPKTTNRVHRLSWSKVNGPIPSGKIICHRCDNPPCFRPIHLFLGNATINAQDCLKKGRYHHGPSKHPENMRRGEDHGLAKLKNEDIPKIREIYRIGGTSQAEIGRMFGVSQGLIGQIVRKIIWRHV